MTPSKNDQTEEKRWNMFGKKTKATQLKQTRQPEEINQKVLAKEEKIYQDEIKQRRQNRMHQN